MLDKINLSAGESFLMDHVLLVGTKDYTSVGRPYVSSAKVLCTVEEVTKTEKVIVFKKRRRKGYQKNQGHRQDVTMVRIDKILYNPEPNILENYKPMF